MYEEPWLHELITVGSVITASTGAGTNSVIAIHADDMFDSGTISGEKASYPVVSDVVELPDGTQARVIAKNTTVDPHQLTLRPLLTTGDLVSVAADVVMGITYNLHAEASGLPAGRAPRIISYQNTLGVVKHSFGATGFEMTNAVYHETIPGQAGSAGQSIYVKIRRDDLIRFEHSKSGLIVFGQQADNLTDSNTALGFDVTIGGSEGFVTFARTTGNQFPYTAGAFDLTNFDAISTRLLDERAAATNDVCGWLGPDLWVEIENSFTNTLTSNLIHTVDRIMPGYGNFMSQQYPDQVTRDSADFTLSFGYMAIRKNGFVYHFKRMGEFNDIRRLGGAGYSYRGWGLWHPYAWTTDMLSGNSRSTIGYEYKGMGDYSRESVFGSLPGAGVGGSNTPYGAAVTEFDSLRYFLLSHSGFHGALANQLVVSSPT